MADNAFYGREIETLTVSDSVLYFGKKAVPKSAFITEYEGPAFVLEFINRSALKSITVTNGVIGAEWFYNNDNLLKVVLLDGDNNECDPFKVPDGFCPVTIAIHLGKRIN